MGDGLGIAPENATVSHQDSRGTGKALALWFQDMAEARLILPIQKAHFRHRKTYLKDFQDFFNTQCHLDDVESVSEIGHG